MKWYVIYASYVNKDTVMFVVGPKTNACANTTLKKIANTDNKLNRF